MKDGGYSDSGADIAYALRHSGLKVVTPVAKPDVSIALDWVFGDTQSQIKQALHKGATCLWLNTQLHGGHPILDFALRDVDIVGQDPQIVDRYDDKYLTNNYLKSQGYTMLSSKLIDVEQRLPIFASHLFPLVLKPIRGRGSQGVEFIENETQLRSAVNEIDLRKFGKFFMVESYLPGKEVTITVMPAGRYKLSKTTTVLTSPWCLPPVMRRTSNKGIAPYSGTVAVSINSKALDKSSLAKKDWQPLLAESAKIGALLQIRAPIRIDCRQDEIGRYRMFDINFKPNMTGAGRPGRETEDGLTTIAAGSIGWSYLDLLENMLRQKWPLADTLKAKI